MAQPFNRPQQPNNAAATTVRKSPLELLILQEAMAQNADANTMSGFAFGKLLRGIFDDWKANYDARGDLNRMAEMNPNKRNEILAYLEQNNRPQWERMQKYLGRNDGKWRGQDFSPTPTTPTTPTTQTTPTNQSSDFQINREARAVKEAAKNLLGDPDFLKQRLISEKPWEDNANWKFDLKTATAKPFDEFWDSRGKGWQHDFRF